MIQELVSLLLPAALLALLLVAPRRGGRPPWKHGKTVALFVLVWAALSVTIGLAWNRFGLAALWYFSGNR